MWSNLYFISLKIFGSNLENGLESEENGYREDSKLSTRNEEDREGRGLFFPLLKAE